MLVDKVKGKKFSEESGIPIAAGLIVGEALVGVGFALYYVINWQRILQYVSLKFEFVWNLLLKLSDLL
jgi:uncharacterized oligopeptide transporter (OPT) family protein